MAHDALLLEMEGERFHASIGKVELAERGNVVVDLAYSSLNYKDALAIANRGPVVRAWPMVPGIDGAGIVSESSDPRYRVGERAIATGWGLGELHFGCLAGRVRVEADWLVPLADSMTARDAMAIGTAGLTAMLCAMALEDGGAEPGAEVLVTGATGGVGSIAVSILAGLGYRVVASSGRPEHAEYLQRLGATEVVDRATLTQPGKPLQRERWAGVVDTVGSHTLANAIAQTRYGGVVAACGLAQGMDLAGSVAPFILRGVRLQGVDSVRCPYATRVAAWERLAKQLDRTKLASMVTEIGLEDVVAAASDLLDGRRFGRTVVKVG